MRIALLLLLMTALAGSAAAEPASSGVTDTSASPHAVVRAVGMTEVKWMHGFWAERFATCEKNTLPQLWRILDGTEHSQFLHNFRIAAGLTEGRHRGAPFNDGEVYKFLEAAAAIYAVTRDPALDRRMDETIAVIRQAQRADGYLQTRVLIQQRSGDQEARPFQDRLQFEMYNFGHLLTAACIHHRATGKTSLLEVARKAADFLDTAFAKPTPELARQSICPSHYMGMIELYRTTREPRHLALAKKFIAMRDLVADGTDDNQDRVPFRQQNQAVGHAVRANYLYAGAADLYAETGDETLLRPLLSIWDNVALRKMCVTGACGALYDGASPDGSRNQRIIGRTHQAYGRDYQLPQSTAHNETCASVANALWNWRMLQITGEARFADVLELVLYNAALAGVSLDGKRFFYTNTLRQLDAMPAELRWSRQRQEYISSFCCPGNLARTIAQVNGFAYGQSEAALWVHLYGGNTLDTEFMGGRLKVRQETEYPWDGRVKLTVDAAPTKQLALRLRIPGWARDATLSVNGKPVDQMLKPGSYAEVRRTWSANDVVELNLPMPVRLLEAHPLVEEARNQVAVQRGPVVYCLESADLPKGTRVADVLIPRTTDLKPVFRKDLLRGVVVLEGKAEAVVEPEWSGALYRDLKPLERKSLLLTLIPYYAWSNRDQTEMTVWMPLAR